MLNKENISIIGGGWAGLSAAIYLKQAGQEIQLYESSRQLGGRARGAQFKTPLSKNSNPSAISIDNGQHILVGACQETLRLLTILGIKETDVLLRQKLSLFYRFPTDKSPTAPTIDINSFPFPAPFHLIFALLFAKGFTLKEKFKLLTCLIKMKQQKFLVAKDISLENYLKQLKQTYFLLQSYWEPLCLAILNTPIKNASSQVFLRVLSQSFDQQASFSDTLLFKQSLDNILPKYSLRFLGTNTINRQQKITKLHIKKNQLVGFDTNQGSVKSNTLILATPLYVTRDLLRPFITNKDIKILVDNLDKITFQPITTIYLQYEENFSLDRPMTGLLKTLSQWVFDRRFVNQKGLLAVVISASGKHETFSNQQLIIEVDKELRACYSASNITVPELLKGLVCREKKATFNCCVDINERRPNNITPINGLYLAGDYTQTNYPSTLEGAIISGKRAAKLVNASHSI